MTETRKETANRIANNELLLSEDRRVLADVIEAVLKERDERAAKIVNDARFEGEHDLRSLAHRIRNEES